MSVSNLKDGFSLREFISPGQDLDINVGDEVEVFVDRMEDRNGENCF